MLHYEVVGLIFGVGQMFFFAVLLLLLLCVLVWFWQAHLRARELALLSVKQLCNKENVQWLDDSVTLSRVRFRRLENGRFAFYRTFVFDYARAEGERAHGQVSICAGDVQQCVLFAQKEHKTVTNAVHFSDDDAASRKHRTVEQDNVVDLKKWVKGHKSDNDE